MSSGIDTSQGVAEGAGGVRTGASGERLPCQVCGRRLAPLVDGTSRPHFARRKRHADDWDRDYCRGAGFRLARWEPGQQLRHHSGDLWQVVEDRGGLYGTYWLRCLAGREKDREMAGHGEYMHRHGWTPIEPPVPAERLAA